MRGKAKSKAGKVKDKGMEKFSKIDLAKEAKKYKNVDDFVKAQ
jgi:hypothetical protein